MSKLKKVVAALLATATVGTLSVSAFADYAHPEFDFNLNRFNLGFSKAAVKQDSYNYAMANCKEGNINSTSYILLSVVPSNTTNKVSNEIMVTSLSNYRLDYRAGKYSENSSYRLRGETDEYGAYVSGKWDP